MVLLFIAGVEFRRAVSDASFFVGDLWSQFFRCGAVVHSQKGVHMNKAELVGAVQKSLDESKAGAERAVNAVIDAIKTGVKKDKSVQVVGFGTFSVRKRAARDGRNPQTGETIKIKASRSVAFKPSKTFKDMV